MDHDLADDLWRRYSRVNSDGEAMSYICFLSALIEYEREYLNNLAKDLDKDPE